jgi:hypothetical protein
MSPVMQQAIRTQTTNPSFELPADALRRLESRANVQGVTVDEYIARMIRTADRKLKAKRP